MFLAEFSSLHLPEKSLAITIFPFGAISSWKVSFRIFWHSWNHPIRSFYMLSYCLFCISRFHASFSADSWRENMTCFDRLNGLFFEQRYAIFQYGRPFLRQWIVSSPPGREVASVRNRFEIDLNVENVYDRLCYERIKSIGVYCNEYTAADRQRQERLCRCRCIGAAVLQTSWCLWHEPWCLPEFLNKMRLSPLLN